MLLCIYAEFALNLTVIIFAKWLGTGLGLGSVYVHVAVGVYVIRHTYARMYMSMMRVRHTPPTWHTSALRTSLIMEEHAFLDWSLSHWRSRGEQRSRRGRHPPSTIVSNVETLHVSFDHSQCSPRESEQKALRLPDVERLGNQRSDRRWPLTWTVEIGIQIQLNLCAEVQSRALWLVCSY